MKNVSSLIAAAVPFLAVLLWLTALIVDSGTYGPGSVLLIGIGWLTLTTIATVGLVLVGGRWARNTLLFVLSTTPVVAIARPLDMVAMIALGTSGVAAVILLTPQQTRLIRKLPSAAGPPPRAVVVTMAAAAFPLLLGLIPSDPSPAVFVMAVIGVASAFLYSRTIIGGLVMIRYGLITTALVLALFMGTWHAITAIVLGVAISVVARSSDVAVAFQPLIEKGTVYAIPPELTPKEIRDGARIDEKGRPW